MELATYITATTMMAKATNRSNNINTKRNNNINNKSNNNKYKQLNINVEHVIKAHPIKIMLTYTQRSLSSLYCIQWMFNTLD